MNGGKQNVAERRLYSIRRYEWMILKSSLVVIVSESTLLCCELVKS